MKQFLIFLFTAALCTSIHANDVHNVHLSMCELRFNTHTSKFEVAIRIFIDDLEKALENEGAKNLKICTPDETSDTQSHINKYIDKYFTIQIDGVVLKGKFLGKEVTEDLIAVWFYVEYTVVNPSPKKCILTNNILLDIYDDQKNIMDIKMNNADKDYAIFESGRSSRTFMF